jgi:phosphonate transport system ATP-binding protein
MAFLPAALGLFGRERTAQAAALLERVGLSDKEAEPVKNLSGGQKQRVAIARALLRHPAILLADEPVASLDPVTGRQILELLRDIQRAEGLTILMNSHNLELSQEFSSRLLGLREGRVVFDGPSDAPTGQILSAVYGQGETP